MGYAPLTENSPLRPSPSKLGDPKPAAKAAASEFHAWGEAFRRASRRLIIRFVASDALAFCYALQHCRVNQDCETAFWYRDRWHYEPLILELEDYGPQASGPTIFDVIDTSNLVDHLGALNILTACSPLLISRPSSAIYTEMLVLRDESFEAYAKGLLCGDIPTISLLFGLKPVQFWTNTTTFSNSDESLFDILGQGSLFTQSRYIMVWKSTALPSVKFDAKELARFTYNMYLQMFQDESWANRFMTSLVKMLRKQYEHYTRVTLAAILCWIKSSRLTNWSKFIELFCDLVLDDRVLNMGTYYVQELFVHLHLFGLKTEMAYEHNMAGLRENLKDSSF